VTWRVIEGDCIDTMRGMDEASVDAYVEIARARIIGDAPLFNVEGAT